MRVLTVAASRALDRAASERFGIPSIVLMENAAIGLARLAREWVGDLEGRSIAIVVGPGNNGGDGYAMARHLANAGAEVVLIPVGTPRPESDAARNALVAERMAIPHCGIARLAEEWDLVVDAIFGTGLDRPVEGAARDAILAINRVTAPILAVDLRSGLDGDSGSPLGVAVEADCTAVTVAPRPAMFRAEAERYLGVWRVIDIGAPGSLLLEFGTPHTPPHEGAGPTAIIRPSPPGDRSPS